MTKPITIAIKAAKGIGTDAPTADDFLGQVRDFLDVLRGVEKALASDGENELIWRVTNAQMNSPISVELTPFARDSGIFVDARAEQVERATMEGFVAVSAGDPSPRYFNNDVMAKVHRMHGRVRDGLDDTVFSFDKTISKSPIIIDRASARKIEAARQMTISTAPIPYRELGSIEGFVSKADPDGMGRAILRFKSRLDGAEIKAFATGDAYRQIESLKLSDVWQGARVRVYGTIHYRSPGMVDKLIASAIEVLDQGRLPGPDEITDETFTSGVASEAYLEELRRA